MFFKTFLKLFTLAFALGAGLLCFATFKVDLSKVPIPWMLITLLLFPAGYCAQAMLKLPESNEHPSLSSSELRRLKPIIASKSRSLMALFSYYIISAAAVLIGFYTVPASASFYRYFVSIAGGMVSSSLFSFAYINSIMAEIQSFKSLLIHRAESLKAKKELLDILKKEAD